VALPDGRLASSGASNKAIRLWDVQTWTETDPLLGHGGWPKLIGTLEDGRLASGSCWPDNTVRLWDLKTETASILLEVNRSEITSAACLPDNRLALGYGRRIRLFDVKTGAKTGQLDGDGHATVLLPLPGGMLASGSEAGTIRLWDLETGVEVGWPQHQAGYVTGLALLPDGRMASSHDDDKTIRLWELKNVTQIGRAGGHWHDVHALTLLPDGRRLASLSSDQTIRIWDVKTGAESGRMETGVHQPRALISLPGDRLALGRNDCAIGLWSLETRTEIAKLEGHKHPVLDDPLRGDWVSAFAVLPGGMLAAGHWTGPIRLWDLNAYDEGTQLRGHKGVVWTMAVLPDGGLASGSSDKTVRLWDCASGTETARLEGHEGAVRALAVSLDGRLASASFDKTIRLWDVKSCTDVGRLQGHSGQVTALTMVSDAILASGSTDKTIRLWDVNTCYEIHSFKLDAAVLALAAVPGGRLVAGVAREHPHGRMHWLDVICEMP
jgi:WD40 repeat protein